MQNNNNGLIAAAFTPFHKDYSVNYDFIEDQIDQLVNSGVTGVLICGSTGEGYSLSTHERKMIAEVWRKNIPEDFHLFVHVGHNSIPDARELAAHANKIQASGILLSAPNYFKPESVEDLVAFCRSIVKEIGEVPIYYYHIPALSGVNFSMAKFLQLADDRIPNFKGIKFSYEDLDDLKRCIDFKDQKYELIFGRDEILLDALKLGVTAALGSTYNYMAPLFNEIIDSYRSGEVERAAALQKEATMIIDVIIAFGGGIVAGKALMSILGVECGPLRLPLRNLDKQQIKRMETALSETVLFKYLNNRTVRN